MDLWLVGHGEDGCTHFVAAGVPSPSRAEHVLLARGLMGYLDAHEAVLLDTRDPAQVCPLWWRVGVGEWRRPT